MNINDYLIQSEPIKAETFVTLPKKLPVKKLGKDYKKVAGYVKISDLARVKDGLVCVNSQDEVKFFVDLAFTSIGYNKTTVEVAINQDIIAVCQRCQQKMIYPLAVEIKALIVNKITPPISEKYPDFELIEVPFGDKLELYQLIEDEIILAMPYALKHDENNEDCKQFAKFSI